MSWRSYGLGDRTEKSVLYFFFSLEMWISYLQSLLIAQAAFCIFLMIKWKLKWVLPLSSQGCGLGIVIGMWHYSYTPFFLHSWYYSNKNTQPYATINRKIYCFVVQALLNMFFGHYYAHHQEPVKLPLQPLVSVWMWRWKCSQPWSVCWCDCCIWFGCFYLSDWGCTEPQTLKSWYYVSLLFEAAVWCSVGIK